MAAQKSRRPLRAGVYAPTMTFFDETTEDLDITTIKKHAVRLADAGLVGLVTMGSNGEAVHLSNEEKIAVTKATREALDEAGHHNVPVIAGATDQSVRGTVVLCKEAAEAGADYVLILPPSYYRAQSSEELIVDYFKGVAEQSPLPIILYNYPGAVSGVDMDSDLMIRLWKETDGKVVGAKFTDANTGKLNRVADATEALTTKHNGGGKTWGAFGGIADFVVQTAVASGTGVIAGTANVMPKLCVKVWNLCEEGNLEEAVKLQKLLSRGDWILSKGSIAGTKAALSVEYGYGGFGRRPLPRLSSAEVDKVKQGIAEAMAYERSL